MIGPHSCTLADVRAFQKIARASRAYQVWVKCRHCHRTIQHVVGKSTFYRIRSRFLEAGMVNPKDKRVLMFDTKRCLIC